MQFLDLTLPTVAENLALDEALLDEAEASGQPRECLRLWESPEVAVILGRSSQLAKEASADACRADGVPILRRCSGGCAVIIGPGCLMYSVLLSYQRRPYLRVLDEVHRFVLGSVKQALAGLIDGIALAGTSDVTWEGRKFSGNSLRCKRDHLLYHGTLLYDFPLDLIGRYLQMPPREPEYRAGRGHAAFITNVRSEVDGLKAALRRSFSAKEPLVDWPRARMQDLLDQRYARPEWHAER